MAAYPKTIAELDRWVLFRGRIVPLLLLVSFVSILFSGTLSVLHDGFLTRVFAVGDPAMLADALVAHLLIAALAMLIHATYLLVMSNHLVYRHPAEEVSVIAVPVYTLIAIAYVAYAVHSYLEAVGAAHGFFAQTTSTYSCFLLAYLILFGHGLHDLYHGHRERPRQRYRSRWMAFTDGCMAVFFVWALVRSLNPAPTLERRIETVTRDTQVSLGGIAITAFDHEATPKDGLIATALLLFTAARSLARSELRRAFPNANADMLKAQRVDFASVPWNALQRELPSNDVTWLDIGGRRSRSIIVQLIDKLIPTGSFTLIAIERDGMARSDADTALMPLRTRGVHVTSEVTSPLEWGDLQTRFGCNVLSMCHVCYDTETARAALRVLNQCTPGTLLVLRFTSDASYYRTLSTTMSDAIVFPYVSHVVHQSLLNELHASKWATVGDVILRQYHDIGSADAEMRLVNWLDAAYGERAADAIERYVRGLRASQIVEIENSDRLVLLRKSGVAPPVPASPPPAGAPAASGSSTHVATAG